MSWQWLLVACLGICACVLSWVFRGFFGEFGKEAFAWLKHRVMSNSEERAELDGDVQAEEVVDRGPENLPWRGEREFVGRAKMLGELDQWCRADGVSAAAVHDPRGLRADGGVGKTELAIAWARRAWASGRFPGGCFFLSAESESVDAALAGLAALLGVEAAGATGEKTSETADRVRAAVQRAGLAALFVVDNVASAEQWREWEAGLPGPPARWLVTTRADGLGPGVALVPVGRLSRTECWLLLRTYREDIKDDPEAKAAAVEIGEWLDGWAVAVALVGAYLKSRPRLSVAAYRDELRQRELPALRATEADQEVEKLRRYREQVDVLMGDVLDVLKPVEVRLIEYAAVLPEDLAPAVWLREVMAGDDVEVSLGPGETREAAIEGAIERLKELGLLRPIRVAGDGEEILALHRVLRRRVRELIGAPPAVEVPVDDVIDELVAEFGGKGDED